MQFGPSSFRPTVQVEGKYVAFAIFPDAARGGSHGRAARTGSRPQLERACESLPSKLAALIVTDITDSLPSLLASLPGTLQTMINTSIALAKARAGDGQRAPDRASPVDRWHVSMRRGGNGSQPPRVLGPGPTDSAKTGSGRGDEVMDQQRLRPGGRFRPGDGFGNPVGP